MSDTSTPAKGKVVAFPAIPKPDRWAEFEMAGDSLAGVNVLDGDVLLCRLNVGLGDVAPGRVFIVRVGGRVFASMIRLAEGGAVLYGASPDLPDRPVALADLTILGLVVELRRSLVY